MPAEAKTGKGLATFQLLGSSCPSKLVVFAMDGNKAKLPSGIDEWESREPGSLAGVLNAYGHCLNNIHTKQPFTSEDVLRIHDICVDKVVGTAYDKRGSESAPPVNRGFRTSSDEVSMFRLIPDVNLSREGCKRVAENIWKNMIDSEEPSYMSLSVSSAKDIEDWLIRYINTDVEERPGIPPFIMGMSEERDNQTIPKKIQETLDNLYKQLDTIPDDHHAADLKITTIVSAIQELEQIHPFRDANCRTFCLVLLNSLLMQQGYDPAIIDDPNKFDGFSVEELVETIKLGMVETRKLVEETYEQEYSQSCSELSDDSDNDVNYNGYYYLSDNSELDTSEESEARDSTMTYTNYADRLAEQLNTLAHKQATIENFSRIKKEVHSSKEAQNQEETPNSNNRLTR
jgi:Fic family protein